MRLAALAVIACRAATSTPPIANHPDEDWPARVKRLCDAVGRPETSVDITVGFGRGAPSRSVVPDYTWVTWAITSPESVRRAGVILRGSVDGPIAWAAFLDTPTLTVPQLCAILGIQAYGTQCEQQTGLALVIVADVDGTTQVSCRRYSRPD